MASGAPPARPPGHGTGLSGWRTGPQSACLPPALARSTAAAWASPPAPWALRADSGFVHGEHSGGRCWGPPRLPRTARPRASWPRPRRAPGRAAHFCECTARTRLPGASRRRGRDDGRAPSGWGFSAVKLGIQSPAPPPRGWRRAGGRTCRTPREGDGVSVVRRAESGSRPRSCSWRSSHTDSAAGGVQDLPPAGGEPRLSVCLVQSCVDTRDALRGPLEGARPHV